MWIKYGTARQAIDENIIQCMRFSCRITKTKIHTHSGYLIIIAFARYNRYAIAPQCYVMRTLPLFLLTKAVFSHQVSAEFLGVPRQIAE